MDGISEFCWVSFRLWQQTMGVRCTTMVVDKVGVVMILFTAKVSVPGCRVILGMLARIRSTRALSSGTKRCSDGLHRTLIPSVERPADAQFRPISDCAQGRADLFESECSMGEQGWPCPCHRWCREIPVFVLALWAFYLKMISPFSRGSVLVLDRRFQFFGCDTPVDLKIGLGQ